MPKQFTDRRENVEAQIAYYALQARLARQGLDDRRTPEFYERQIQYLRTYSR